MNADNERLIIQRKLRYPYADGTTPKWHDHPDCMSGPLKISEATKRGLMSPSGEYIYRAIRRHDEVVWEGEV
jgi:hypothetical protein